MTFPVQPGPGLGTLYLPQGPLTDLYQCLDNRCVPPLAQHSLQLHLSRPCALVFHVCHSSDPQSCISPGLGCRAGILLHTARCSASMPMPISPMPTSPISTSPFCPCTSTPAHLSISRSEDSESALFSMFGAVRAWSITLPGNPMKGAVSFSSFSLSFPSRLVSLVLQQIASAVFKQ